MRVAIFNDTSVTRHYGCTAVMAALTAGLALRGAEIAYRWPVAIDWQPDADRLARQSVDTILVNGEGSIHHSADRPRSRQLCALGPFARDRLNVPAYLLNATIEELDPQALDDLRAFTAITVRETRTREYLAGHGISCTVAGDLSLSTTSPEPRDRTGILVTDSVLRDTRKQLSSAARAAGARFERMKHRPSPLSKLRARWRPAPLPLTGPTPIAREHELRGFLSRLAGAEMLVTGRFHSVCLAMLTGTPVFALGSNTGKIPAILQDALGDNQRMIPTAALSDLVALNARAAFSDEERCDIDRYIARCRAAQSATFDTIVGREPR